MHDYHIHLYYDDSTYEFAVKLGNRVQEKFAVELGRFHRKNVGPHPRQSMQISVPSNLFGQVLNYVTLNRGPLTVFTHPLTGDDLKDHTEYAIWMGELLDLNLSIFEN